MMKKKNTRFRNRFADDCKKMYDSSHQSDKFLGSVLLGHLYVSFSEQKEISR
jgi:hypothetical protein